MSTLKVFYSALLLFSPAVLLAGCGGECARASDCAADEVCYQEVCTNALSPYFEKGCQVDIDCDFDGDGVTELVCELGQCRFRDTTPPVTVPEAGVTDGSEDAGDAGEDAGVGDAEITDTSTIGGDS